MYSVADFGDMIADRTRMGAYEAALRRAVKPGCVVVDVGTGTGIFALWACKLGAARVYAIDPHPAIEVAKENAKRNGYADRITFIRKLSTEVELPEKADVLISDMRGAFPLFGKHLVAVADARKRFLAPGGVQIGERDDLYVAPVALSEFCAELVDGYADTDIDFSASREAILEQEHSIPRRTLRASHLLADPACWATLEYATTGNLDASGKASLRVKTPGKANGLALWFRATLLSGIGFDNGPSEAPPVYRPMFLPWTRPVPLVAGDRVDVELRATYSRDGYLWGWNTRISGSTAAEFKQSNFRRLGGGLAQLRQSAPSRAPGLGAKGHAALKVLEAFAAGASQGTVADQISQDFPKLFRDREAALAFAQRLGGDYGAP